MSQPTNPASQQVFDELTNLLKAEAQAEQAEQAEPPITDSDDWLADLADITTSPELVRIAQGRATNGNVSKPKRKTRRIAGETHDFKPLHNMKQHPPRTSPFYGLPPVYRHYQATELAKASYSPQHLLGMEPFLPYFGHLHMGEAVWL